MAQTTYTVPLTPLSRTADIITGIGVHAVAWVREYNAELISIVIDKANNSVAYTFSNPVPAAERSAIRAL